MRAIAIAAALLGGCTFSAEIPGGLQCGADGACPDGQACSVATNVCAPACALSVATNFAHTCMVRNDATVWCWGSNEFGQLGDDTTTDASLPVQVAGIADAIAVVTGVGHSCALLRGNSVQCWGRNDRGQLGDRSNRDARTPVQVNASSTFVELVAGDVHTCARDLNDGMWCWGDNGRGQLGNGSFDTSDTPIAVPSFFAKRITAGGRSTCAVDQNGDLYCWGRNDDGQLAQDDYNDQTTPTRVTPIASVTSSDMGPRHLCAIGAGGVRCAGFNRQGQLAVDPEITEETDSKVLVAPAMPVSLVAIDAGALHTCGLDGEGHVRCWGQNTLGALGDAKDTEQVHPTLAQFDDVTQLSAGDDITCVRTTSGLIECAGNNARGQFGTGKRVTTPTPTLVPGLTGVSHVAAGAHFSCSLDMNGAAKCWGQNDDGELADDTTASRVEPAPIVLTGVTQIAGGIDFACAIVSSSGRGEVRCWGGNDFGQLGTTGSPRGPVVVPGLTNPTRLAAGARHVCAIDGADVKCWGRNENSQLGRASGPISPVQSLGGMPISVAAGDGHSCAVIHTGEVRCWGSNADSELGIAMPTEDAEVPVTVTGVFGAKQVYAVGARTYAIHTKVGIDVASAWGNGCEGKLGTGTSDCIGTLPRELPLTGVSALAVGERTACAIADADKRVYCWGLNDYGQAGDGGYVYASRPAPAAVPGLTGVAALAAGREHVCAALDNATVQCWGYNGYGQLGSGVLHDLRPGPVQLVCE